MKFAELEKKTIKDLITLLKTKREEFRSLRFSVSSEQEKNVRKLRDIKKTIAQILTLLNLKDKAELNKKEEISEIKEVELKKDVSSETLVKEEEAKN